MIDILLKFNSREQAAQVGQELGYSKQMTFLVDDESDPEYGQTVTRWVTTQATIGLAICVIGQHQGANWWVMVRSLVDMAIPAEIQPFIVVPDPENPAIPNQRWAD